MHGRPGGLSAVSALVAALLLPPTAAAVPSPQDRERQVNTFTTAAQSFAAVASDSYSYGFFVKRTMPQSWRTGACCGCGTAWPCSRRVP